MPFRVRVDLDVYVHVQLYTAHVKAKNEWMASESIYITAESTHGSAKEAAEFAKGQYDQLDSTVTAGQAEYNVREPALTAEMDELVAQQPILEQVKTLVSNMAAPSSAKGKVQFLKMLPALKKLANAVVPPRMAKDKSIANKVYALRSSLAETETAGTLTKMLVILEDISATMSMRIGHIKKTLGEMETDLSDNRASLIHWETQLVSLSDDKDKAENTMTTAELQRNQLNGVHIVKEEAYNDYHALFVDEADKFAAQLKAIAAISAKIDEAIASCASPPAEDMTKEPEAAVVGEAAAAAGR